MSTPIISGKGNLRTPDGKGLVAEVNYQMREKPSTDNSPGEWWGGFILDEFIEQGDYVIELEDGRSGACKVGSVTNWQQCALPDVFTYGFKGIGPLTPQKE